RPPPRARFPSCHGWCATRRRSRLIHTRWRQSLTFVPSFLRIKSSFLNLRHAPPTQPPSPHIPINTRPVIEIFSLTAGNQYYVTESVRWIDSCWMIILGLLGCVRGHGLKRSVECRRGESRRRNFSRTTAGTRAI